MNRAVTPIEKTTGSWSIIKRLSGIGFVLVLAALLVVGLRGQDHGKESMLLGMLTDLQPQAERLADLIGSEDAQQHAKLYVSNLTAAKELQQKLDDLEAHPVPSQQQDQALVKRIKEHITDAVNYLTSLQKEALKTADAIAHRPPLPANPWVTMEVVVSSAAGDDFANACMVTLSSAAIQLSVEVSNAQEASSNFHALPLFTKPQHGWLLHAATQQLLFVKDSEDGATNAAELWDSVNAAIFDAVKGQSLRNLATQLQLLKARQDIMGAASVVAKEALKKATPEEQAALTALIQDMALVEGKYQKLLTQYSELEKVADPDAVVAANQEALALVKQINGDMDKVAEKVQELQEALAKGKNAHETAIEFLQERAEAFAAKAAEAHSNVEAIEDRMRHSYMQLLAELPDSAHPPYGEAIAEDLLQSITGFSQLIWRTREKANGLAAQLQQATSLKDAGQLAEAVFYEATKTVQALHLAGSLEHKFSLFIILERDMALSGDLAFAARIYSFSDEFRRAAEEALQRYDSAVMEVRTADSFDGLAEAASLMQMHAWELNHLVLTDKSIAAPPEGIAQ